jgi:hypothetical protein
MGKVETKFQGSITHSKQQHKFILTRIITHKINMNSLFKSPVQQVVRFFKLQLISLLFLTIGILLPTTFFSSCGVYTFKDVSIDYSKYKTIKIDFIDNRASYKNPQLSAKITDALKQKISNQTKLTVVNNDDANYRVSGYISNYAVSTAGISEQKAATNRLTVGAHITLMDNITNKPQEFDVSRDFDFAAGLTITQAESQLLSDIIKNETDEIFNRMFSNW